jgi:hypothetical protein
VEPARGPAKRELALGVAAVALLRLLERRQEHLLDRALDGADGEALLHDPVGERLVEVVEGVEQAARRARPLAALAGELDCGRDVVRLEQRAPERLELGEVVLAVTALRAARLRVAEAALPAAQRVGTHPKQLCRRIRPDPAHVASVPGQSQKCSAITSHVPPPSWDARSPLHRFSVAARAT